MATEGERIAKIHVDKASEGFRSLITAYVPSKVNAKEFGTLQSTIVDKIIKDLTGCPCLSGAVDIVFKDEFRDIIRVDLHTGKTLQ